MPASQADIDNEKKRRTEIWLQLDAARKQAEQLAATPVDQVPDIIAHQAKIAANKQAVENLEKTYNQSTDELARISKEVDQNTPKPRSAMTDGEKSADDERITKGQTTSLEAQQIKDNTASRGLSLTNAQLAEYDDKKATAARADATAQQTAAHQANADTETARKNRADEQSTAQQRQQTALQAQQTYNTNTATGISSEAQQRAVNDRENFTAILGASERYDKDRMQQVTENRQAVQQRLAYSQALVTNFVPMLINVAMKLPKGSKVAGNLLTAVFTFAKQQAEQYGGLKEIKDVELSANRAKAAGMDIPDLNRLPTQDEYDAASEIRRARQGSPNVGWNGPVGVDANGISTDSLYGTKSRTGQAQPGTQAANAAPQRTWNDMINSPEGQAIVKEEAAKLPPALAAKIKAGTPREQMSPEENDMAAAAYANTKARIINEVATKPSATTSSTNSGTAAPTLADTPGYNEAYNAVANSPEGQQIIEEEKNKLPPAILARIKAGGQVIFTPEENAVVGPAYQKAYERIRDKALENLKTQKTPDPMTTLQTTQQATPEPAAPAAPVQPAFQPYRDAADTTPLPPGTPDPNNDLEHTRDNGPGRIKGDPVGPRSAMTAPTQSNFDLGPAFSPPPTENTDFPLPGFADAIPAVSSNTQASLFTPNPFLTDDERERQARYGYTYAPMNFSF